MLRIGVVGVGYLGSYHARKYAAMTDVNLVGLADIESRQVESLAVELNVRPFLDYRDMLGQVDAVSIAVPTSDHFEVARSFLASKVHVLLEKPITRTLEEADILIKMAGDSNLVLQVGHLERFNPAHTIAAPYADNPMFIEASRINPFPDRGLDVDVVLDLMIHDLDIILNLVGEPPVSIQASGVPVLTDKVDIANVRLGFRTGCVANLTASRISEKSLRKIRIFQKDQYLSIDYGQAQVNLVRRVPAGSAGGPEVHSERLDVPAGDSLERELKSFIKTVRTGSVPLVSGEDGRRALALAIEIMNEIGSHSDKRPEANKDNKGAP